MSNESYAIGCSAADQLLVSGELTDALEGQQFIQQSRRRQSSGKSLQQISAWLNQQGYSLRRRKSWRHISINGVLDRIYEEEKLLEFYQ